MSVINNAKWVTVSQLFRIITQIISITVLTRFIEPSEFGILALATIITNFALVIKDLGLSSAIIQKKELTNALKNTVFWLNILFGFSLYILIIILSKPISNYYEQNKLINVLWLLGAIFPISSISALHQALLERDSRFKIIAKIEIISSLFGVVIALILAINNYGVYSIVYQLILTQLISSILILINKKWVPTFTFNKKQIKSILEFSSNITIFNIINYFSRNADNIIVGSTFSTTILGVYNLAYRIMLFPLQSVTFIANRSLYPIMSRKQENNKELKKLYLKAIMVVMLITTPMMMGLAYLRAEFVDIFFSENWEYLSELLLWLSLTGILQSAVSTTGAVFMAKNRTRILLLLGIFGTALNLIAFFIGSQFSIIFFAQCYFIANLINLLPPLYCAVKLLGGGINDIFKILFSTLLNSILMIIIIYTFNYLFYIENVYFRFSLNIFIGFLSYIIILFILNNEAKNIIMNTLKIKR